MKKYCVPFGTTKTLLKRLVGGGSAGCVLANRLSADASRRVLLVEAGKTDEFNNFAKAPGMVGMNIASPFSNWGYETVPQKHMNGRVIWWPRGRLLGIRK